MEKSVAEVVVDYLKAEGVKHVFGVAGSSVLEILDAIQRSGEIRFVATQHEQAAAFMADGYARSSGKPGVCLGITGPGATNMLSGVAQAYLENSPLIAIVGDISTKLKGRGSSNWHEIDQIGVFRPVTKWCQRLENPNRIAETMQTAFRAALSGRKGPVLLSIPTDLQTRMVEAGTVTPPLYRADVHSCGDPAAIHQAAQLLREAAWPVIWAGGGVWASGCREELLRLAEILSAPFGSTHEHKGVLPEDHPLAVGVIGVESTLPCLEIMGRADVVLAVGCTFSEFTTGGYGHRLLPRTAKLIHLDIDPLEIGKNYPCHLGLVGDAKATVTQLLAEIGSLDPFPSLEAAQRRQYVAERKDSWKHHLQEQAANNVAPPVHPLRLMLDARDVLGNNAITIAEGGGTHAWFAHAFDCHEPGFSPGDFSVMGSGYCLALGAKLAHPERQVVSFSGDGSFMMILPELATAVANDISVVAIVSHNSLYGNVRVSQHRRYGGRHTGTELLIPNLAELARIFGAYGERVERPEEIKPALRRALASGRPAVLDVITDSTLEALVPPTETQHD